MAQAIERIYRLEVEASKAVRELKKINKSTNDISKGFRNMQRAAATAFAVFSTFRGLEGIVRAGDQIQLLEGSFEALTGSADRAADMMQRVYDTVADTGAGIDDVATTYQRLTVGLEELGATNTQIQAVADTFIKLGRVSGTSIADTNAALVQFSQGLASGKLQGDELRSIMERLPLATKLIQQEWNRVNEGMSITRGQVKELGKEGKLSAELIANAFINGAELTAEQFKELTFTLEQEYNVLFGEIRKAFAELSDVTGFGDAFKESIQGITAIVKEMSTSFTSMVQDLEVLWKWLDLTDEAVNFFAVSIGVALIPALLKLGKVMLDLAVKNPITAILTATAIGVLAVIRYWDELRDYFLYRIPDAFYTFQANYYAFLGDIEVGMKNMWNTVKDYMISGVNNMIEVLNSAIIKFNQANPFGDFNIALIDMVGYSNEAGKATSEFYTKAVESSKKASEYAALYTETLEGIGEAAEEATPAVEALVFAGQNDGSENPFPWMDDLAKDFERLQKQAAKYTDEARPMIAMARAMSEMRKIHSEGWIDDDVLEFQLKKIEEEYRGSTENISEYWEELKDTINGFSRDFTNTLVDGLAEGEFAFKDFAENVLKTMAKMMLNKIFEKFFAYIAEIGASFFSGLGGGKVSGGGTGPGGGFGLGVLANEGDETNMPGILQLPQYGFGKTAATGPGGGYGNINVYNNAGAEVEVQENKNSNGQVNLDILIERKVQASLTNGGLDKAMRANYGIGRRAY